VWAKGHAGAFTADAVAAFLKTTLAAEKAAEGSTMKRIKAPAMRARPKKLTTGNTRKKAAERAAEKERKEAEEDAANDPLESGISSEERERRENRMKRKKSSAEKKLEKAVKVRALLVFVRL
jgi:hypothetical protein